MRLICSRCEQVLEAVALLREMEKEPCRCGDAMTELGEAMAEALAGSVQDTEPKGGNPVEAWARAIELARATTAPDAEPQDPPEATITPDPVPEAQADGNGRLRATQKEHVPPLILTESGYTARMYKPKALVRPPGLVARRCMVAPENTSHWLTKNIVLDRTVRTSPDAPAATLESMLRGLIAEAKVNFERNKGPKLSGSPRL